MTTTFSSGKIKGMMPTLSKISNELIEVVGEAADNKIDINYRDMASRFMCEIIGEIAFGLKCKSPSIDNLIKFQFHNPQNIFSLKAMPFVIQIVK